MKMTVDRLSVKLQDHNILNDVCFEVGPGETLGLLGPNGSGKSTLIRALAGLISSARPHVELNGLTLQDTSRQRLARRVAFVPQHARADAELSVVEIVSLGRTPHRGAFSCWSRADQDAVQEAMALMQLEALAGRAWHRLSGGERQRCQIARALAQKPDVLLLDEPTNHLDIQYQLELMRLITALPVTVIVALHDLNLAANYCQQLVILKEGRLVAAGTPPMILTAGLIQSTWRVDALINRSEKGTINILYA